MKNFIKSLILFVLGLMLCACANYIPLSSVQRQTVHTADLVVNDEHCQPDVMISPTNIGYGSVNGLLPVLIEAAIDNAKQKNSDNRFSELKRLFSGYHFPKSISLQIKKNFMDLARIKLRTTTIMCNAGENLQYFKNKEAAHSNFLMTINLTYGMKEQFDGLFVNAEVKLYRTDANDTKSRSAIIYKNSFYYTSELASQYGKNQLAINYWMSSGAEPLKKGLLRAAEQMGHTIASDLSGKFPSLANMKGGRTLIQKYQHYSVYRIDNGNLDIVADGK